MIDVHCLVHKESPFFPLIESQMKSEKEINFYIIPNDRCIGRGRLQGFTMGNSPYVSFVDSDDLIQPGIFEKLNDILDSGYSWVYTNETLIDSNGDDIQPGWSSHPHLYPSELLSFMEAYPGHYCHHLVAFRRELLRLDMLCILPQLFELENVYLFKELGRSVNFYHLDEVGYYWRIHEDNAFQKFSAYKVLESYLVDKWKRQSITG